MPFPWPGTGSRPILSCATRPHLGCKRPPWYGSCAHRACSCLVDTRKAKVFNGNSINLYHTLIYIYISIYLHIAANSLPHWPLPGPQRHTGATTTTSRDSMSAKSGEKSLRSPVERERDKERREWSPERRDDHLSSEAGSRATHPDKPPASYCREEGEEDNDVDDDVEGHHREDRSENEDSDQEDDDDYRKGKC